jgi:hypothetical protein
MEAKLPIKPDSSIRQSRRAPAGGSSVRRIDVFVAEALAEIYHQMAGFYSNTGRPSMIPSS